jgi:hypothetical protein
MAIAGVRGAAAEAGWWPYTGDRGRTAAPVEALLGRVLVAVTPTGIPYVVVVAIDAVWG